MSLEKLNSDVVAKFISCTEDFCRKAIEIAKTPLDLNQETLSLKEQKPQLEVA